MAKTDETQTTKNEIEATPLTNLVDAAAKAQKALNLKYCPMVVRNESMAFSIAARTKAGAVMLGKGAFWVVCLADATRLKQAGYEWARN
jgi:hypothetical protein